MRHEKERKMAVNADKPHLWKADTLESIDFYNDWFLRFAPSAFRKQRSIQTEMVTNAFQLTDNLRGLSTNILRENPGILQMLRMTSAPPLARDRLIGLRIHRRILCCLWRGRMMFHQDCHLE